MPGEVIPFKDRWAERALARLIKASGQPTWVIEAVLRKAIGRMEAVLYRRAVAELLAETQSDQPKTTIGVVE